MNAHACQTSSPQLLPTIAVTAGGTGGHFFPALALTKELSKRGYPVVIVTDTREKPRFNKAFTGYPQIRLPSAGIVGHSRLYQLKSAFKLLLSTFKASWSLRRHHVRAVVGFGGYPSVPPILGGWLIMPHRPALIIHEGNAVLGRANAFLSHFASVLALSFAHTKAIPAHVRTKVTGMALREEFTKLAHKSTKPHIDDDCHVVIWGGSLGAQFFCEKIPQAMAYLPQAIRNKLHITQQAKVQQGEKLKAFYTRIGIKSDIHPFFDDVPRLLGGADLIIGRAGGSSVAEMLTAGCPCILIPFPYAAGDEQTANAQVVQDNHAGWEIAQKDFTPRLFAQKLETLICDKRLRGQMQSNAHNMASLHGTSALADLVCAYLR